jgi:hypothetical protein
MPWAAQLPTPTPTRALGAPQPTVDPELLSGDVLSMDGASVSSAWKSVVWHAMRQPLRSSRKSLDEPEEEKAPQCNDRASRVAWSAGKMKKTNAVVAARPDGVRASTIFDGNFVAPVALGAAASAPPLNLDAKLTCVASVGAGARTTAKASKTAVASTTALPPQRAASSSAAEARAAARPPPRAVAAEAAAATDSTELPATPGSLAAIMASLETEREASAKFEMRLMSRLVRG